MSKLISFKSIENFDFSKINLKCGIEIHQQLNTGKLFCSCPCEIVDNQTFDKEIQRNLRFSLSETGEVDKAALHEFKKGKYNIYKYNNKIACLVDLDEEPPREVNIKAVNVGIRIGQMLNLSFFDKLQFMRKLIINGSIISGFQRTALLGINGYLETQQGKVEIDGVNVEEDSSKTLTREDGHTIFSLDRQGIPLIEITTGPQIKTPLQAQEVALQIGNILRSFPETKRGLGTIRQDLNVSIENGARIEIKGAQNLKLIPDIIENEMRRQVIYISILEELKSRKINKNNFSDKKIYELTKIFEKSKSKVISDNLTNENCAVLGIKLNNFENILKVEMQDNYRFATEISDRNKAHFPKIKGLFHSDELPNYGITQKEVDLIKKELKCSSKDSFIILSGDKSMIKSSLNYILEITEELIEKVPTEVRNVDPKGTKTQFLRPMPGSARMYPETDVKEIEFNENYLETQKKLIPELYGEKISRLEKELKIENDKIIDFLNQFSEDQIKNLMKIGNLTATNLYETLINLPKDIKKREKIDPINLNYELFQDILKEYNNDNLNKKTIRDLFINLYKDNLSHVSNFKDYLKEKNLISEKIDEKEIELKIKEIIEQNKGAPFGALMGKAMGAFNGKVDGKIISEILKKLN